MTNTGLMTRRTHASALAVFACLAVTAAACSSASDGNSSVTDSAPPPPPTTTSAEPSPDDTATVDSAGTTDTATSTDTGGTNLDGELLPAAFTATGGVEQVTITGATPGDTIELVTSDGTDTVEQSGTVDEYGSLLFRNATAPSYTVVNATASGPDGTVGATVDTLTRDQHPDPAFFAEQRLAPGLNYIETRDGTTLAANVVLPGPIEDGPYPTVVEYSGYSPADPEATGFKDLFGPLGYAYVGVNMRGTGCSGGSFRYFEYTQSTDGYDAIETVAAQPWAYENQVGMVGVSYPGISQLFVARTQPPSLAAITPFSVVDDSYNSTLYPGGLLNTGFAVEWTQDRVDNGQPAIDPEGTILEEGGQGWAKDRIAAGDDVCAANQSLRAQNPDLVAEVFESPYYDPVQADDLSPRLFVGDITVPTFVAGAWQDEQTGGRFATMLDQFSGTDKFYATVMNGLHTESIGPTNFPRWVEFLDLYVAERVPTLDTARVIAPLLAGGIFGTGPIELPADRFAGMTYDDALAEFESEPPIWVLFEEGAADGQPPRTPLPRFVAEFDAWPIPSAEITSWYLDDAGLLTDAPAEQASETSYLALPDGVPATFLAESSSGSSSDIWRLDVEWDWQEPAPGTAANFLSPPLTDDLVMIGSGSADLWVQSNLGDTDLEVTITEVRPDGQEMYVQSGWLRASQRALDEANSTEARPVHTHAETDAEPLPEGEFALARVEIFPFAHVFRAGSQLRVSIDAPGGNRPVWVFNTLSGGEQVTIGLGADTPSRIVLPVVPGIEVPAEYPECGALRGQPCRAYTGS